VKVTELSAVFRKSLNLTQTHTFGQLSKWVTRIWWHNMQMEFTTQGKGTNECCQATLALCNAVFP